MALAKVPRATTFAQLGRNGLSKVITKQRTKIKDKVPPKNPDHCEYIPTMRFITC
jgi:hypothetical protein